MNACSLYGLRVLASSPDLAVKVVQSSDGFRVKANVGESNFFLKTHRGNERLFKSYDALANAMSSCNIRKWETEVINDVD